LENLKIQDGSGRHFEKLQDRHIAETVWPNITKLGTVTHIEILTVLTVKILKFYKFTMVTKNRKPLVSLIFIILHLLLYLPKPQIL